MVVNSRSSRGRPRGVDRSRTRSPVPSIDREPDRPSSLEKPRSERVKRHRIASTSERETLQKRRRTESPAAAVPIPLRNKSAQESPVREEDVVLSLPPPALAQQQQQQYAKSRPPPLIKHDSTLSNSPLGSPSFRPQYDLFQKIEQNAQKIAKKGLLQRQDERDKEDKRRLRSEHGSTKSKTELAQYFPFFEDMLSLEPVRSDVLTVKTPLILVDDTPSFEPPEPPPGDFFGSQKPLYNAEIVDLSQFLPPPSSSVPSTDPLHDHVYLKAHQKAERHEKQIKNGDRERAQHEKYQLERLLEELRGPDWLKTLGISGITDTEKKRYEVKRNLFIRETKGLIDKFRRWKEEEKRRKLEKQQQALVERAEDIDTTDNDDDDDDNNNDDDGDDRTVPEGVLVKKRRHRRLRATRHNNNNEFNSRPTSRAEDYDLDTIEVDHLASQQLLVEAKLANLKYSHTPTASQAITHATSLLLLPPPQPFISFFQKRHIRDAAVAQRQRGRKVYAFGQELQELDDQDFELPDFILTEDAIRASQRNRRRMLRNVDD